MMRWGSTIYTRELGVLGQNKLIHLEKPVAVLHDESSAVLAVVLSWHQYNWIMDQIAGATEALKSNEKAIEMLERLKRLVEDPGTQS